MKTGKALVAGVVGGAAMSIVMAIFRALGLRHSLEMLLGTLFLAPGAGAWVLGLLMHLGISALIALLYARGFERATHRAGASVGLAFAAVHVIVGGFALLSLPLIHPRIGESIGAPGELMSAGGWLGITAFVTAHAMYGAIVGEMYEPAIHSTPARITLTRQKPPRSRAMG